MNGSSILVVDDDADITCNVLDILTDLGYDADSAHDGESALQLVRGKAYDVAVLDFKMPDMDGATLYKHIKLLSPETVGIMVTAYANRDGVERAKEAGVRQVLRKPVDPRTLLSGIDEATQR